MSLLFICFARLLKVTSVILAIYLIVEYVFDVPASTLNLIQLNDGIHCSIFSFVNSSRS